MNNKAVPELIDNLQWLYEKYSHESRAATQPYQLEKINNEVVNYEYQPDKKLARESLLEHIGVLPMIATTIYPHIKDNQVELGRALIMLAIHDIGELVTGDEIIFKKKLSGNQLEQREALKLLDHFYHDIYMEMQAHATPTAKFAKAIDKLSADILDFLTPAEVTIQRFKHSVGVDADMIIPLIIEYKRPYMLWNPFMTELHEELMNQLGRKLAGAASNPDTAASVNQKL